MGGELKAGSLPAGVERVFPRPAGGSAWRWPRGDGPGGELHLRRRRASRRGDGTCLRGTNEADPELERYAYRQRVMELMYEAKDGEGLGWREGSGELATRITDAMEGGQDCAFMTNLLDDLHVAEGSLRSPHGPCTSAQGASPRETSAPTT